MMIEPPGELLRSAVFEIDDHVLAFAEHVVIDELAGLVGETFILDLGARVDVRFVEAREHRCGGNPIETIVVI